MLGGVPVSGNTRCFCRIQRLQGLPVQKQPAPPQAHVFVAAPKAGEKKEAPKAEAPKGLFNFGGTQT